MSTYNDLFVRDSLSDADNTIPRPDVTAASPDIIPWGTSPATDPSTLFSGDYDQDPGRSISYGATNYIYVRAKNYSTALATGTVYLYSAYLTQLSQPGTWTRLSTAGGNNTSTAAADDGDIAVTEDPFVWSPAKPTSGNPYVLIASVATTAHPNQVPHYKGHPAFDSWDANVGGVAARTIPVPPPPTSQTAYTFSGLVALNNSAQMNIQVSLVPTNGVVGDSVQFSFDTPGTTGPIGIGSAQINGSPGQTFSVDATVDANYSGTFTCQYTAQTSNAIPFPTLVLTVFSSVGGSGGGHHGGSPTLTPLVVYTLKAVKS